MHLLLTLHHTPNWTALATRCELPLISTLDAIQDAPGYFLCGETHNYESLSYVLPTLLNQFSSNGQLWIGARTAENFLSHAVAQGSTLVTAAQYWRESVQNLLEMQRQQRQRVRLFNLEQALAQPHRLCELLELGNAKPGASLANNCPPLARLAASQYLAQQPELQNLNLRLQATCTLVGEYKIPELHIDLIIQEQQQQEQHFAQLTNAYEQQLLIHRQLQSEVQEQQQKLLSLENFHQEKLRINEQMIAECEKKNSDYAQQLSVIHNQHKTLQTQLEASEKALSKNEEQLKNASDERDLILLQLHKVQEELETYHRQQKIMQAELEKNSKALSASEEQLKGSAGERDLILTQLHKAQEELQTSHGQCKSLQAELDKNSKALNTGKEQLNEVTEERDLILAQLHKAQEELEAYHGRSVTLQAELEKSKKALSNSEAQLKVITEKHELFLAQLNKAKKELQTSHGQCKSLQAELDKNSKALNTGKEQLHEVTEERDLILAQLHKVQEELEAYYLKLQEKAKAHNSAIATIQEQGAQINSLTQEQDALRTNIQQYEQHCKHLEHLLHLAHLDNLQHQRDNQKLQQDQVQLQQDYAQEQQDHKHALLARDKQYTREAAKLEAELRKTKARAANAEYSKLLLQQELDKLRHSISWKAASPVRAIGRLIRKNEPTQEKLTQEIGLLLTSEYFDVDWYLRIYTDVAESNINPAEHYLLYGAAENRLPGPLFDGNWYLQRYPDVAEQNINPLLHFILFGQQEGRDSSPILLSNDSQDSEE